MTPEEVLERAAWLIKSQQDRVQLQEDLQKVFQLDWNDKALEGKPDWVMPIKDPQPFNAMQWLVDVMAHDEPQYNIEIPQDAMPQMVDAGQDPVQAMMMQAGMEGQGDERASEMADKLEGAAKEVYRQNDLRSPTSLQRDELYAAFVNGMVVDKIADLRLNSGRWTGYANKKRGASPFYIRSTNPAQVYYEYDEYGLCEVLHRYLRPLKEIVRLYGGELDGLTNVKANEANGYVLFAEYWTEDVAAKWIEQIYYQGDVDENYFQSSQTVTNGYFLQKPMANVLGFIPFSLKVARGSSVFHRTNMVYPHLYSGHKSQLFLRQNLFLTVASTLAFMLVNPQTVQETDEPNNAIQWDFSRPANQGIKKGDKITPLNMNISRDFYEVMNIIASKVEESTVSKVVAGQSPGGVTAASGINLLIDGGKLTISSVQGALEEVRSQTLDKVFQYVKAYPDFTKGGVNAALEMYLGGGFQSIDPAEMPDNIQITTKWTAFLPQDKALAVQTFLPVLEKGLLSSDFFYGQIGVQDTYTLRQQIEQDKDRALADQMHEQQVTMQMQQEQAAMQQPQQQGMEQGMPQEQTQTVGEQALEPVTPNPIPPNDNPAQALNAMQNSIQNPMMTGG